MKKLLMFLLICTMILGVVGCGGKENKDDATPKEENNLEIINNSNSENKEEESTSVNNEFGVEKVRNTPETKNKYFKFKDVVDGVAITSYTGSDEIVVIPKQIEGKNVVAISSNAFANNEKIRGVKIPNNVIVIEDSAFCNCYGLEIVLCGDSLKIIEEFAFNYCKSLNYIELNDGLQTMLRGCLLNTDSLKTLYIPSSVTDIDTILLASKTNVTIITESGSAAEQYANEKGIPCKAK